MLRLPFAMSIAILGCPACTPTSVPEPPRRTPSPESLALRASLQRDVIVPGKTIERERAEWEAYAGTQLLPAGSVLRSETIGGVPSLWVEAAATPADGVVIYVHGGGLVSGSPRTHREFAARLALQLERRVLLPDYRLAPEHPFPAALDDLHAFYAALIERIEPRRLIIGGESSGAALALAFLIDTKHAGRPLPAAAFFVSGHFDLTLGSDSITRRAAADPTTTREALDRADAWYAGSTSRASPRISPVFADLGALPPTLIQVGDDEILLDDSTRLADAMRHAGGRVELSIWPGMWHAWPLFASLPEAGEALEELAAFMARSAG